MEITELVEAVAQADMAVVTELEELVLLDMLVALEDIMQQEAKLDLVEAGQAAEEWEVLVEMQ
jgi:hypothetical protein